MHSNNLIRCASLSEVPSLNSLIRLSSIALGEGYYSSEQIHGLNQHVFGVDTERVSGYLNPKIDLAKISLSQCKKS